MGGPEGLCTYGTIRQKQNTPTVASNVAMELEGTRLAKAGLDIRTDKPAPANRNADQTGEVNVSLHAKSATHHFTEFQRFLSSVWVHARMHERFPGLKPSSLCLRGARSSTTFRLPYPSCPARDCGGRASEMDPLTHRHHTVCCLCAAMAVPPLP
jgi:hypothetical protein